MVLLQQVIDAAHMPVTAAGGIYDGRGYAAALAMRSSGLQARTRLILTEECDVRPLCKQSLLDIEPGGNLLLHIDLAYIHAVSNSMTSSLGELPPRESKSMSTSMTIRSSQTYREGNIDNALVIAWECAGAIKYILPAGDVIEMIAVGGERILKAIANRVW